MREQTGSEFQERVVNLNFNRMRKIANIALRRASLFIAFATNAVSCKPEIGFNLEDKFQFRFTDLEKFDDELKHNARLEFEKWVIGNSLRDLVDAFSLYMANCLTCCHIMDTHQYDEEKIQKKFEKVEKYSVTEQIREFSKYIDVDLQFEDMFSTLLTARNCLSHNLGIVRKKDINTQLNNFSLRWVYLAFFISKPDGQAVEIDSGNIGTDAAYVKEGAKIQIKRAMRERLFEEGGTISLTRHELGEICMGFNIAITHVNQKLFELARARGIPEANETGESLPVTSPVPPSSS